MDGGSLRTVLDACSYDNRLEARDLQDLLEDEEAVKKIDAIRERAKQSGIHMMARTLAGQAENDRAFLLRLAEYAEHKSPALKDFGTRNLAHAA